VLGSRVQPPVAADNGRTAEHGVDQLGRESFGRSAQEPRRIYQTPRVQVRFNRFQPNPVMNHQGEREDPPRGVPHRPGWIVDETLGRGAMRQ
jgi:hypothetical protein